MHITKAQATGSHGHHLQCCRLEIRFAPCRPFLKAISHFWQRKQKAAMLTVPAWVSLSSPMQCMDARSLDITRIHKASCGFKKPSEAESGFSGRFTWLWMVLWHLWLFLFLSFCQIGFKGRIEEYF